MGKENQILGWQFEHAHYMWALGAKCNTCIVTLNPYYLCERKMKYLNDNLNMHIYVGGKMQYSHYDPKSTLSIGDQNEKSMCQIWNIFGEISWLF